MSLSRIEIKYFNEKRFEVDTDIENINESIRNMNGADVNILKRKCEVLEGYIVLFNELFQLTRDTDN